MFYAVSKGEPVKRFKEGCEKVSLTCKEDNFVNHVLDKLEDSAWEEVWVTERKL